MNLSLVSEIDSAADLAYAGMESAPIDVIRVGTFTDMNKRVVEVTQADLDEFVSNHKSAAAGQEIPLDVDHRRQEAAGWIVRFFRDGDVLKAVPSWNSHGVQLVGDRMYRYISATINLAKKTIISVSLTNFPAVKQLAPIALSEFPVDGTEPATDKDTDVVLMFTDEKELDMTLSKKKDPTKPAAAAKDAGVATEDSELSEDQDDSDGSPAAAATPVTPAAASAAATPATPATPTIDLSAEVARIRTEMQQQMRDALVSFQAELTNTVALSEQQRVAIIRDTMANIREEQELANFAEEVTATGNHALPIRGETLRTQLSAIPSPHRATVMEILRTIHQSGTVDFSESGTSQGREDRAELSKPIKNLLREHLKDGGDLAGFFEANVEDLGPMARYDLAEFAQ